MDAYPAFRAVDVSLRDGSTVRIRPVRPDDGPAVLDLFDRLSPDALRMRFHGLHRLTAEEVQRFTSVDYDRTFGLVAETAAGRSGVIALANYVAVSDTHAEIGIAVDDEHAGRGIGSIMIEHLGEAADAAGISVFEAEVLTSNAAMLEVLRQMRLPVEQSVASGVVHFEFPTSPTPEAVEAFELREGIAAAAAVARFFTPRSVAVLGASRRRGTIGGELFHNILEMGFEGPVYPVNPSADVVQSVAAYRTLDDIPGPVDLAVIVVPAVHVLEAARACGAKGVGALLIISSGFSEIGAEGRELQRELLSIARGHGMRIVGPNCMGLINADPTVSLNATFSPIYPDSGRLAFSSQSGALGIAVIDRARQLGLGMSTFVSVGNKADISGNDLLQYWEQDDGTDVILLYLESFGNPRKFARIARRVSKNKPIVAVKSGRSTAGARAAASHTGSFAAGDVAVDALFRQAGVIRTDTLEELFDVASLLGHQELPKGDRVGILTNAGGLGILCADACSAAGLEVPELSDETVAALRSLLPREASVANPVDMIASATPEQYAEALRLLDADERIDSIVVIFIPPLVTRAEDVARALTEVAGSTNKTLVACFLGVGGIHDLLRTGEVSIPSYTFPEQAARALAKVSHHAAWLRRDEGHVVEPPGIDRSTAISVCADLLQDGERWLEPDAITRLFDAYGIRSAASRTARTPAEVGAAAAEIGRPVALKIDSRTITHKTDVGGVALDLRSSDDARAAAEKMIDHLGSLGMKDALDGFLVQEMVPVTGAEMFVGMNHDPSFGPLVACGAGGTLVELMKDVAIRITPLTDLDIHEMVTSLRTYPLLEGYRGSPRLDIAALEDLLMRVGLMVEDLPHLAELDLNPVIVLPDGEGCVVVDSRVRIATPAPETPRGARRAP